MRKLKYIRLIFLMLTFFALGIAAGCAPSQIRYQQEDVSRDYTYIDFTENTRPLTLVSEVGGEHMTFYKVLAFRGDKFRVTVTDLEGRTAPTISGDGIAILDSPDSDGFRQIVEVEEMESLFTIELDAHPFGKYRLHIEKLQ